MHASDRWLTVTLFVSTRLDSGFISYCLYVCRVEELADNIGRRINDFAVQITGSAAVGKVGLSTMTILDRDFYRNRFIVEARLIRDKMNSSCICTVVCSVVSEFKYVTVEGREKQWDKIGGRY